MTKEILVFAELQDGKLTRAAWEAVAGGQRLADDFGGQVSATILGERLEGAAADLATANLEEVIALESPALSAYTPDGYTLALGGLIREREPQLCVASHTYLVRDFAPKVAAWLGTGFISDCLGYRIEMGQLVLVRQMFQGKFNADVTPADGPAPLISFQAGSFREDSVRRGAQQARVTLRAVQLPTEQIRTRPGERFREVKQAVDLTQAEIIVAAGRGIKAPENLELVRKLADALGGEIGASRPICDGGWLPMDRQIGSSGQTVTPKLYMALGISGAIQHQVGMKGARTIVAVNKDREAPIFEVATYGIVADLFEIVPPLIDEIKKAKAG